MFDTIGDKYLSGSGQASVLKGIMSHIPHILIVDDHKEIRESVKRFLEKSGMRASVAKDARDAETMLGAGHFDLIVLDVMMPGEDGLSFCTRISKQIDIPIIMLTALGEDTDRIVGLEIGADDYLAKPFNPRELLARIKAVLRRAPQIEKHAGTLAGQKLRFAHLILDVDGQILTDQSGNQERLTTAEFKLLTVLIQRARMVLSRDQLLDLTVGKSAGPLDRTIDNQISRLRRKIEVDVLRPKIITTVRNGGYCLSVDVEVLA
ncbi:MAG: two-component system OmpR family response regulator [Maritalea sp.]